MTFFLPLRQTTRELVKGVEYRIEFRPIGPRFEASDSLSALSFAKLAYPHFPATIAVARADRAKLLEYGVNPCLTS